MQGDRHASFGRLASAALAGGISLATMPAAIAAATPADVVQQLPACGGVAVASSGDGVVVRPWQAELDEDGVVVGHRMTLRRGGKDADLRAGRGGFAVPLGPDRLLLGERENEGTRLAMVDVGRACRIWTRQLERLAYPRSEVLAGSSLRFTLHEPGSRRYEGTLLLDVESGASNGMIEGECITDCDPNDGPIEPAAYQTAGAPRPVPSFPAGGWPADKGLRFRWRAGDVPPDWAKGPLKAAADDARRTSRSASPRFVFRTDATDSVRYTSAFPTYCRTGIACAARSIPSFWAVWLRPHGTDFAWGTLRWCQKQSSSGCFDIRRVMLHELGHIVGLDHPSSDGRPLGATETVMHAITPAKPKAGSTLHAFRRCDVATLQELYDVPDNKTPISTCNDVATTLHLAADRDVVARGSAVTLTAVLRVDDRNAYRQLAGAPLNGRSVKLKYRRARSDDEWRTAWMRSLYRKGRYELTIEPDARWEFKAVFPAPDDEGLRYSRSAIVEVRVTS